MRFYTHRHKYYCGIDLHTSVMYVCITDTAKPSPSVFCQADFPTYGISGYNKHFLQARQVAQNRIRQRRKDVDGDQFLIIIQITEDLCCGIERETIKYILAACLVPPRCMRTLLGRT